MYENNLYKMNIEFEYKTQFVTVLNELLDIVCVKQSTVQNCKDIKCFGVDCYMCGYEVEISNIFNIKIEETLQSLCYICKYEEDYQYFLEYEKWK